MRRAALPGASLGAGHRTPRRRRAGFRPALGRVALARSRRHRSPWGRQPSSIPLRIVGSTPTDKHDVPPL